MTTRAQRAERFRRTCAGLVGRLPGRLAALVPPTLVGFALVGGFTFVVDLLVLTLLRSGLGLSLAVAVTLAYVCALSLNFLLNRWLTFAPRRPVGLQILLYVLVVAVNYLAIVLGVTVGLSGWGVPYPVARVVAGLLEVTFLYSAQRWVVFAHDRGR